MHRLEKNFVYETYSESIGPYIKSKQVPLTETCFSNTICLTTLTVNSVNKFSEIYLSYYRI